MVLESIRFLVATAFAFSLGTFVRQVCLLPLAERPRGGFSGKQRDRAFAPGSSFELMLRFCGNGMRHACSWTQRTIPRLRAGLEQLESAQQQQIIWGGTPGGLSVHEAFFIICALGVAGLGVGVLVAEKTGTWLWTFPCLLLGTALLPIRLKSLAAERVLRLSHEFPGVIDLAALAMNAGSDLTGALKKIAERQKGVLADELEQLLMALDMGMTRKSALLAFEERCPVDEVRDLVRAVIMAEQKGASVASALVQQARSSRQRRSVRAEEAAARAGVMLILPLMLLMCSILLILVGPLVCRGNVL